MCHSCVTLGVHVFSQARNLQLLAWGLAKSTCYKTLYNLLLHKTERGEKEKQNKMACRECSKWLLWLQNNGIEFASIRKIKNIATPGSSNQSQIYLGLEEILYIHGNLQGLGKNERKQWSDTVPECSFSCCSVLFL